MIDPTRKCRLEVKETNGWHAGPGIVVLSSSMQLLHINRQATQLASRFGPAESGTNPLTSRMEAVRCSPLTTLASYILADLEDQTKIQPVSRSVIHSLNSNLGNAILIRGFGLPGSQGVLDARVVLLLTEATVNQSEYPVLPHPRSEDSSANVLT